MAPTNARALVAEALGWPSWDDVEAERIEAEALARERRSPRGAHDQLHQLADSLREAGIKFENLAPSDPSNPKRPIFRIDLPGKDPILVASPAHAEVWLRVLSAGRSGARLLISGPTGTGKESLARGYHQASRRGGAFCSQNCGAIPLDLAEAELFGAVEDAGTNVAKRRGLFREAHGGTLFLDEVGELPLDIQSKLLRAVEEGEVRPVGGRVEKVDIRVLAATNRNLDREVAAGRFRADLLYRLQVVTVQQPSLCDRPEELFPIAGLLLERVAGSNRSFTFTPKALYAMACYDWPGNIRELKNVLTDAVTRSTGSIRADHLSIANQPAPMNDATTGTSGFSREQIELVLDLRRQGKTEQAVRAALREEFGLQMSRAKYYRLLRQTGVSRDIARRRTIHDR